MFRRTPFPGNLSSSSIAAIARNPSVALCLPLLVEKITKAGGCLPREEIERIYGVGAIELAIHRKLVRALAIKRNCKQNKEPPRIIQSLVVPTWDESKPQWL